jgi:hypothetical protein
MRRFAVIVGSLVAVAVLLAIAVFCVYGFMEIGWRLPSLWELRTMYGAIGVVCLCVSAAVIDSCCREIGRLPAGLLRVVFFALLALVILPPVVFVCYIVFIRGSFN